MGKGLFITGTDTGVGKTFVACGLAAHLRSLGYTVGVMKPVETGCTERNGELFPQDASYLRAASGCKQTLERICPYRLRAPLAPSVAAAMEDVKIDVSLIANLYGEISSAYDITLVEGAGGLLVPILADYTYADLAQLLKLPVLVVAGNRLGAINHLLLTLEHASCRGLRVLGYILNQLESPPSPAAESNAAALRSLTSIPFLGEIAYVSSGPGDSSPLETNRTLLASLFAERVDLDFLQTVLPQRRVRP